MQPRLKRPIDGFSMVQNIHPALVLYQPSHALAQLDAWRRSRSYAMRMIVAPDESQLTIPARDEIEYQAKVKPGSWWYGWAAAGLVAGFAGNAGRIDIGITDEATGRRIFSDLVMARQIDASAYYATAGPGGPVVLEQPYPIVEPGLLNFEIHNNSTAATQFQMVLCVMEPCTRPLQMQDCITGECV